MNGPFYVSDFGAHVRDATGANVATGEGPDEDAEQRNAEMVCDALNAAYYAAKAAGSAS